MRNKLPVLLLAIALAVAAGTVQALGFGKTVNPTAIGQPLDFLAVVRVAPEETIEPGCVSAEVLSGDHRVSPLDVHVALQGVAGGAERRIRVTTGHGIDEPVVTVTVTLGCSARISRSFVAFLDPPIETLARARSDDPAREGTPSASGADSLLAVAQPAVTGERIPRAAAATTQRSKARPSVARSAVAASSRRLAGIDRSPAPRHEAHDGSRGRSRVATAAPTADGPRLLVQAAASTRPASPRPAASAPTPDAPVALAAGAVASVEDSSLAVLRAGLALERERNQRLEAALAQLRRDGQAQQKRLLELQAQVHQAETERELPPLIFVIAGLGALLVLATGLIWTRLPVRRSGARWFELSQQHAVAPSRPGPGPDPGAEAAKRRQVIERWKNAPSELDAETAPAALAAPALSSSIGGLEVTTVIDNRLLARMAAGEEAERSFAATELPQQPGTSVDALIDLDQQVDFLLILGQDDAAVDLLARETDPPGSMSALPYRRLLVIHRRRGDRPAFESVAAAFRQRFGVPAPSWEMAERPGRTLDDEPTTLLTLQHLWPTPLEAMRTIEAWLLHGQPADDAFELEAYRELLFLYGVARDLQESPAPDTVDVLLPLDEPPLDLPLPGLGAASLSTVQLLPTEPAPLDFDLSLETPVEAPSELREAV